MSSASFTENVSVADEQLARFTPAEYARSCEYDPLCDAMYPSVIQPLAVSRTHQLPDAYVHPSSPDVHAPIVSAVGQGGPQSAEHVPGVSPQSHRPLPHAAALHAAHVPAAQ